MSDLGLDALRFAFLISLLGLACGIIASRAANPTWLRLAERSITLLFALVSLAMLALFYAFATGQFELAFVAKHSARSMSLPFRLAALWGGQAGSLLLWLWILTAYAFACVRFHRKSHRNLMPWVIATLHANALFFLVFVNFITNPFAKLSPEHVMSDGAGLNPLLQHPAMMIHPVMLYTGFVGFVVPFSFAFAAMVTGELSANWLRATRRWTLVPWFFLSIGILLGGRWAYEVLGWGGYWAWDPVENASLMPWLAATAYLHSVMIQEKRDMLKIWNLALIGLTYTLCLFGTFLTRSGVVQSVHSFASAGWFGWVFFAYVFFFAVIFFSALVIRRNKLRSQRQLESVVSREASFIINNWAFMAMLAVVFWGTLFPVFAELIRDEKISLGPPFFNVFAPPIGLALLFFTGVGPLIAWRRASLSHIRKQFLIPALIAVAVGLLLQFTIDGITLYPLLTWSMCAFVTATVLQEYAQALYARIRKHRESPLQALGVLLRKNQRRYGGYVVHLGMVFIFFGIAGAAFNEERLETLHPGDSITLNQFQLRYLTATPIPAQHYGGATARIALYEGGTPLSVLAPQKRMYWLEEQPASIPAIHSTLKEDLYVTLTALEHDGAATLKVHYNPLVNWIWLGGLTFVLGAIVVLWPHPERITAST